jgi:YgiT-type zinc finger domain-containing protein
MRCSIKGCPGEYEIKKIAHTVRTNGELMIIDNVPAEVCLICGDILLSPEIVYKIEKIIANHAKPKSAVPLYEYAV